MADPFNAEPRTPRGARDPPGTWLRFAALSRDSGSNGSSVEMVPHECTISYDGDCRSVLNYRGAEPRRRSSLDHDRQRGHPALAGESGRMSDHENANKESQDSAASVGSGALLRGNGRSRRSCLKAPRVEKRQPHRSDGVNSRRAADSNANSCRFLLPFPSTGTG